MQIRLTVLGSGSRSGHQTATATASGGGTGPGGAPASCDVLVTAPAGTALSAVASGLAATVGGPDTGGTVVLYAGTERLDPARCALGEPPLVDGAVLSLNVPGPDVRTDGTAAATALGDGPQLHVVAGPDAGGVHLLHPGAIRIGRSADADVPLDDPDVSRLHCTVTVLPDGRVAVADLGSTNGTTLDGAVVGAERVALAPGALLRVGESTLRLAVGPGPAPLPLTPDLEGHLSVPLAGSDPEGGDPDGAGAGATPGSPAGSHPDGGATGGAWTGATPGSPAGSHPDGGATGGAWTGATPGSPAGSHPDGGATGGAWTGVTPSSPAGSHTGGGASGGAWPAAASGTSGGSYPEGGTSGGARGAGAYPDAGSRGAQGQIPHPAPSRNGGSAPDPVRPGYGAPGAPAAHWDGSAGTVPAARSTEHHTGGGRSGPSGPASADPWPYGETDRDGDAGSLRAGRIARPASGSGTAGAGHHSLPDRPAAGQYGGAPHEGGAAGQYAAPAHPGAAPGQYTQAAAPGRHAGAAQDGGTAHGADLPGRHTGAAHRDGYPGGHAGAAQDGGAPGRHAGAAHRDGHAGAASGGGAAHDAGAPGRHAGAAPDAAAPGQYGGAAHGAGAPGQPHPAGATGPYAGARHAGAAAGPSGHAGAGAARQTGVEHHGAGGWEESEPVRAAEGGPEPRRGARRGIGAWARKWVRGAEAAEVEVVTETAAVVAVRPGSDDPATLLLTALGPAPRLWAGPAGLDVTLGAGSEVALRETGALGIAGPRARLTGVARSVIARLAALHAPGQRLEIVLISTDRARPLAERRRDWGWLGWLPHVRPAHGQDCRLLLAYDRDQAAARAGELTRRLDDGPLGTHWATAGPDAVREASYGYRGPFTLLVLDGDPGPGALRDITSRLASHGPAAGIHVLALAEAPAATPASPVTETYEAACAAAPAFRDCGTAALLSGDVATTVRTFAVSGGRPAATGATATADAVSAAWAERFARALAPLKADSPVVEGGYRPAAANLPQTSRLLDELGLARATPASLMARWAAATDQGQRVGGLAEIVLGTGRRGPVGAELVTDGPHVLIEGPAGSGRTELLRTLAASLSAAARPDRLGLVLLDGAGGERGDGLLPCTELPHVSAHLIASDPLRMREFAQALGAELKRRAELLDGVPFSEWHAVREVSDRMVSPRQPTPGELRGDLEPQRSGTLRLRSSATRTDPAAGPSPLPRLVVLVDDFDALVAPGLGSTGRPAAGSVVRALEAVAREGARLGVHLIATSARPDRTADTELARLTTLRVELDAPDQPGPGRGVLRYADGRTVPFQGGRVTGRIPRTATLRPTVVPVEWERMGDPPARRPVRELGNGPTDLALLASALDRASHLVSAVPVLFPPAP
ncbi:FtsK/SpoIIIE domain-containing protein [Streptomyces sp. NBC_00335]|uniref:FHA domain-containing protein n=1 Tax=unclassified Streptomyces TaxID=2593676 RepID=UPI00224E1538|nr:MULTISPECIES: FHA domain-containing protein [unclassified Streptomyces]MCX5406908.1 FtsK/SpoIIIE domain-containing protein [Streptomyces sp. NBC_00086]